MPYTQPVSTSTGGTGYDMFTPITPKSALGLYTPRVAPDNTGSSFGAGGGLPICFSAATLVDKISIKYAQNLPKTGGFNGNGQAAINPGWNLRCFIFNSNATTKMPTTLRTDLGTQFLADSSIAPSSGLVEWNYNTVLSANDNIWILIVGQPKVVAELPNGWTENGTYVYNAGTGLWSASGAGGYLTSPNGSGWKTELDPVASLPMIRFAIETFGNLPSRQNVTNAFFGPIYDLSGFGGPGAMNLTSVTAPATWGSTYDFINNVTFDYATGQNGLLPILRARLN